MKKTYRRLALLVAALLLLSLGAGILYGRLSEPHEGEWTRLSDYGHGSTTLERLTPSETRRAATFSIELPEGASQGPDQWYIGYLNLILDFAEQREEGVVRISAATDGFTFLKHMVEAKPPHGVEIRAVELLTGSTKFTTMDEVVTLTHANYLQVNGVQPGENVLTVTARGDKGLIDSITVKPDSGVLRLTLPPPALDLRVQTPSDMTFPVNAPRTLPLTVSTNGWRIEDVELSAYVLKGEADVRFPEEEFATVTDSAITTSVTIVPKEKGAIFIDLTAHGNYGSGHRLLTIRAE